MQGETVTERPVDLHDMGIGTWAWGDRLTWGYGQSYGEEDVRAAFQTAVDAGVRLFDTAEIYGFGESERLLGQVIRATGADVQVATKMFPFPWRWPTGRLLPALEASLRRLDLERVDLYQVHWGVPGLPADAWASELADAVGLGLTRAVGVSNYGPERMLGMLAALERRGVPLTSNQVSYSLLNRGAERSGLLDLCRNSGVRLVAYSPLAQGLLTGKYSLASPPSGFRRLRSAGQLRTLEPVLAELRRIAAEHGKTMAQVALNWVVCKGAVPIPGAKTAHQAQENAGALGWRLTDQELAALDAA